MDVCHALGNSSRCRDVSCIFTMRVPKGGKERVWVLEVEDYSKNGCDRKDKYSSWSGEWVGRKEVDVGREGVEGEGRSTGKGEGTAWADIESPVQYRLPCHLSLHQPRAVPTCWGLTDPQPQVSVVLVCHSKAGLFRKIICFISTDTPIWDIWQKEVMAPCMLFY